MGRKSLPDEIKQNRGTLQKCRKSNSMEIERIEKVLPPKWLSSKAKKIFIDKINILIMYRVLTPLDIDQLAIYSQAMSDIADSYDKIAKNGRLTDIFNKKGKKIGEALNPHLKLISDATKLVIQIGSNFGFSPASRDVIIKNKKQEEKDDFTDFEDVSYE